jgi:hypothetical protein
MVFKKMKTTVLQSHYIVAKGKRDIRKNSLRNSISLYEALTAVTSLLTEESKTKLGKARLRHTVGPNFKNPSKIGLKKL